jgi:hypothetical protein
VLSPPDKAIAFFSFSLTLFRHIYYADQKYSSSSLSFSSSAMVSIAGGATTEDPADPELIVSFGVQSGDFMGRLRARNASSSLIQGELFSFTLE